MPVFKTYNLSSPLGQDRREHWEGTVALGEANKFQDTLRTPPAFQPLLYWNANTALQRSFFFANSELKPVTGVQTRPLIRRTAGRDRDVHPQTYEVLCGRRDRKELYAGRCRYEPMSSTSFRLTEHGIRGRHAVPESSLFQSVSSALRRGSAALAEKKFQQLCVCPSVNPMAGSSRFQERL